MFCGQETTLPRDTGSDNKWYSHFHQPRGKKIEQNGQPSLFSSRMVHISYKHFWASTVQWSEHTEILKLSLKMAESQYLLF